MRGAASFFLVAYLANIAWVIAQLASSLNAAPWLRGVGFLFSALVFCGALLMPAAGLRRKWKTGRFLPLPVGAEGRRTEVYTKMEAGKPFRPRAKYRIYLIVVLVLFCGGSLGAAVEAVHLFLRSGLRTPAIVGFIGASLLLFVAVRAIYLAIRRKRKSGSYFVSPEDLESARAKNIKPKSLSRRVVLVAGYCVTAVALTFSAVAARHRGSPEWFGSELWFQAALLWAVAILGAWQAFRPSAPAPEIDQPLSITPR